jgi:hypothetical protein
MSEIFDIKEFLEEYSLFRKYSVFVPSTRAGLRYPYLNLTCKKCQSVQTFCERGHSYGMNPNTESPADKTDTLSYECQACGTRHLFYIYFSPELDYIYKFGQLPAWEIKIEKDMKKLLGSFTDMYRKGLVCELQSYGIAAFAYYRRITENIIDELLESIASLIPKEDEKNYLDALEKAKSTRVTQDKIDLVKDLLPCILKPEGINPLGVLHKELSQGLHAETDDICLENAVHIRSILTFLIETIVHHKDSNQRFTEGIKSLLEKKNVKPSEKL